MVISVFENLKSAGRVVHITMVGYIVDHYLMTPMPRRGDLIIVKCKKQESTCLPKLDKHLSTVYVTMLLRLKK